MKLQLLPSSFDSNGAASVRQHLTCFVVDDTVSFDAGSLAMSVSDLQRERIRDIVITHAHLDHVAGLPLFVDDLFAKLTEPIRVHASAEAIEVLERDIFNWSVYPKFSELSNEHGVVLEYSAFPIGEEFAVKHLTVKALSVNHKVPTNGFLISDGKAKIALTGDTAETDEFWTTVNAEAGLSAVLVECAFPDELTQLADISHHLTPKTLKGELEKFRHKGCPVYIINIKPMYRDAVIRELGELKIPDLEILELGRVYEW